MIISQLKLSIIICTYNRAKYLEYALESLIIQTEGQNSFEVLIIDNNSSDNTKEIYEKFTNKLPLKYFLEKKQGLSHARNRGIKEAKYDLIAFLDDDAKVSKDWIKLGLEIARKQKVDIFGGPIYPYYESKKVEWFKDEYEIRSHGDSPKYLDKGYLSGSNIFFKKDVFKRVGLFDPKYGMKGDEISVGEETKLQEIADRIDIKRFYHPQLFVYHLVPEYKMKVSYFIKRTIAGRIFQGEFWKEIGIKKIFLSFVLIFKSLIGILSLIVILFRCREKHPYWQNYFIEIVNKRIFSFMAIKGILFKENKTMD